jgi:AcrR family transcriptional regulator
MSERISMEDRAREIVMAAIEVFIRRGYRQAQMDDIAKKANVSKGTLYNYFKSKAHLFYFIVENGAPLGSRPVVTDASSIVRNERELLDAITTKMEEANKFDCLRAYLEKDAEDVELELELSDLLEELWDILEENQVQLNIIDRSAHEFPALAAVFHEHARMQILRQLEAYIRSRIEMGAIRPLPSVKIQARFIMESFAFFAMKMMEPWSDDPEGPYPKSEVLPILISTFLKGLRCDPDLPPIKDVFGGV